MEQQAKALRGFLAHVRRKEAEEEADGSFAGEFLRLKRQSTKYRTEKIYPTTAAEKQENVKKNRYKDIIPFDHSRVKLSHSGPHGSNDYINANFIKGVFKEQAYIATQGPLPNTVVDFLRMVWEYNVEIIVMACREFEMGRKKCERYWPADLKEVFACDPFTVHCESEEHRGDYVKRVLKVTYCDATHKILQLHYVNWPDHGVPETISPILEMVQEMRMYQEHENIPICIHCSAGCGRTGALCAIDYTWNLLKNKMITDKFSVFSLVQEMRTQRPSVVQTKEQYELVYQAIVFLFERYLQPIDLKQSRTKVPVPSQPIHAQSETDFRKELEKAPEPESEMLQNEAEKTLQQKVKFDLINHVSELTNSLEVLHSTAQETNPSIHAGSPILRDTLKDFVETLHTEAEQSNNQGKDVIKAQKPQPKPRASLIHKDKVAHKPKQEDWLPPQEEEIEPEFIPRTPEGPEAFCFFVEDPYFSSSLEPKSLSQLEENPLHLTSSPCDDVPTVTLNGQVLVPTQPEVLSTGEAQVSPDDEVPPPLPERTPESFILADSSDNQSGELVTLLHCNYSAGPFPPHLWSHFHVGLEAGWREKYVCQCAEPHVSTGSPPSPVPPLPERTPESYILASEADLAGDTIKDAAAASATRVGVSQEWCGSSDLHTEEKKPWKRSKVSVSHGKLYTLVLLFAPSFSPLPIPVSLEKTTSFPPPPPPLPPPNTGEPQQHSETQPPRSLTPPLPERTPESFVLAFEEDQQSLDTNQHPSQRFGTSSEWAGNMQTKKFPDSTNRSKSVRVKSSKQEHLLVACSSASSNMFLIPEGNVPAESFVVDTEAARGASAAEETLEQSSEKTPLSNKPRTKSFKFLKNMRKTKETPSPSSTCSGPPPPYSTTPVFRFGWPSAFLI
ncbi:tyrosine-protein phosphatase non-receptor type 22-like [Arapaima gigas]